MASLKQETTPDSLLRHHIPMATVTITQPNSLSQEPPMGVPLLLPPSSSASGSGSGSTRRLPPPCWTPDETSCLIDAYRDKWYSLKRGNLRAAHWQDVADQIHLHCPHVTPPKTAVQCRHKMEKLRKRYRAELLRANSIPHHRFSSSWVYFYKMDAMEKTASPSNASLPSPQPISQAAPLHFVQHHNVNVNVNVPAAAAVDDEDDDNDNGDGDDEDDDITLRTYQTPVSGFNARNYQHPDAHRFRNLATNSSNRSNPTYADFDSPPAPAPAPAPGMAPNYGFKSSYPLKTAYSNNFGTPPPPSYNGGGSGGSSSNNRFIKTRDNSGSPRMEMNYMNVNATGGGVNSSSHSKKKRKMSDGNEKRERGKERGEEEAAAAAMEMVEAIKMLGEGFVKMEKMKMEMIRETERMRMEMEMKRTQMLLDSQHRIVEAFAKGWADIIANNHDNDHAASSDANRLAD